jgi:hypothetical protein
VISKERFVSDYRVALARLREANRNVRIEGEFAVRVWNARRPLAEPLDEKFFAHREYAASGGLEKIVTSTSDPEPFGRVVVANGKRSFVLRRNSAELSYYLEFRDLGEGFKKRLNEFRSMVVNAAFSTAWFDMPEAMESDVISFGSIGPVEREGRRYLRVDFEYKPQQGNVSKAAGWLLLDPALSWVIREYESRQEFRAKGAKPLTAYGRNDYADGGPLPEFREIYRKELVEDKNHTVRVGAFRVKSWRYESTPSKDFTLAAYGLETAERPPPAARHTDLTPYWATGIAVAALAGALLLRRVAVGRTRKLGTN